VEATSELGLYGVVSGAGFLLVSGALLFAALSTATAILSVVALAGFLLSESTFARAAFVFLAGGIVAPTASSGFAAIFMVAGAFTVVSGLRRVGMDEAVREVFRP
jgi:hypothetical protein